MTLQETLSERVRACFTGLWVETHEPEDAVRDITKLCRDNEYTLLIWDCDRGLSIAGAPGDGDTMPLTSLRALAGAQSERPTLLVMHNLHRFLGDAEVMQATVNALSAGKLNQGFVVVLSPVVDIPVELEKVFEVIEHSLPGQDELLDVLRGVATEEGELPEDATLVLSAAGGLTRYQTESAASLSIIRHGVVKPEVVMEIKGGMLKKSGTMTLHRGSTGFANLGGLHHLKRYCLRSLTHRGIAKPKGVMLFGLPGTGKSAFAKALGNEVGRPTLLLSIGDLMGSLVGQSEAALRRALKIADAMSPCVLFVDEIEKGLAGAGGGARDSGVSDRMLGALLTWLNDHTSEVYFVGTCNNMASLPAPFARAGRFDSVFFLDLPDDDTQPAIWDMYLNTYELVGQELPDSTGWTGAEIEACCRLASMLGTSLIEASMNVVPVSRSSAGVIAQMREDADGKYLDATHGGIYTRRDVASSNNGKARRNLTRPSAN